MRLVGKGGYFTIKIPGERWCFLMPKGFSSIKLNGQMRRAEQKLKRDLKKVEQDINREINKLEKQMKKGF